MSRAQEIRQKRLDERKENEEENKERQASHKTMVETEAKRLFDWVLDLLEHPTKDNTKDRVCLYNRLGSICVGYSGITSETFDDEIMRKLADMFDVEEGYNGKFSPYEMGEFSKVVISIE